MLFRSPGVLAGSVASFFPPRTISGNDIFVERLGFIAGSCVWIMAGPNLVSWSRAFWNGVGFIELATRLLPCYVLVLLVLRLMPFDFAMSLDALARKQAAGQIQWLPSRDV